MKELTLQASAAPKIEIGGHVFELQANEVDVLEMALEAKEKMDALTAGEHDPKEILTALKYLYGIIDKILGKGAVKTLSEGRPVGLKDYMAWLYALTPATIESYGEALEDRYA